jgi:hypothetical protein
MKIHHQATTDSGFLLDQLYALSYFSWVSMEAFQSDENPKQLPRKGNVKYA